MRRLLEKITTVPKKMREITGRLRGKKLGRVGGFWRIATDGAKRDEENRKAAIQEVPNILTKIENARKIAMIDDLAADTNKLRDDTNRLAKMLGDLKQWSYNRRGPLGMLEEDCAVMSKEVNNALAQWLGTDEKEVDNVLAQWLGTDKKDVVPVERKSQIDTTSPPAYATIIDHNVKKIRGNLVEKAKSFLDRLERRTRFWLTDERRDSSESQNIDHTGEVIDPWSP
jgi:hypothetical protein